MNLQSWNNQQEEITARKERLGNQIMNGVFVLATFVIVLFLLR